MEPLHLRIVSSDGIEATIETDGSRDEGDYYAIVSIKGVLENKKVYGIDPIQSFALGMKLIEELTQDKRLGKADALVDGASWTIEDAIS